MPRAGLPGEIRTIEPGNDRPLQRQQSVAVVEERAREAERKSLHSHRLLLMYLGTAAGFAQGRASGFVCRGTNRRGSPGSDVMAVTVTCGVASMLHGVSPPPEEVEP